MGRREEQDREFHPFESTKEEAENKDVPMKHATVWDTSVALDDIFARATFKGIKITASEWQIAKNTVMNLLYPPLTEGETGTEKEPEERRLHSESDFQPVAFIGDRDLNDPMTYADCHYRNWSCNQLREEIYRKAGYVLLYEKYFGNDMICMEQSVRIHQMLFWFGKEHRRFFQDTSEGRWWLRKWLFMFENDTENLC